MIKEEKPIFLKVSVITILILFSNIGIFMHNYGVSSATGFSIADTITRTYMEISNLNKIFLILQWALLLALLAYVFVKDKLIKKDIKTSPISIKKINRKGTEIDQLYSILKDKKRLGMSSIAKAFNVNKETALGWCRTLEDADFAIIDYPAMGEPIIIIK